jgi:endonuclease YncB( thermonuclease family)
VPAQRRLAGEFTAIVPDNRAMSRGERRDRVPRGFTVAVERERWQRHSRLSGRRAGRDRAASALWVVVAFAAVISLALAGGILRARLDRAPGETARVARVLDGDTVILEGGETVRVIGIDTPETHHPDLGEQPFGAEAAERTTQLVLGRSVGLEADLEAVDQYGRRLAHVWVGDTLLAEILAEEGLGRVLQVPPNLRYADRIRAAEERARSVSAGLWTAEATPIPVFRRR